MNNKKDVDNLSMLIIGDDELLCEDLYRTIAAVNIRVYFTSKLNLSLDGILATHFDLFVIDPICADLYNATLISDIKKLYPDSVIIIITDHLNKNVAIELCQSGIYRFKKKHFDEVQFLKIIFNVVKSSGLNCRIQKLVHYLQKSRIDLLSYKKRIEMLDMRLRDTRTAFAIFVQNIERDRDDVENKIAARLRALLMPPIMKLRQNAKLADARTDIDILIKQVDDLTSERSPCFDLAFLLSATELRIASLIKRGVTTDEIARQLHVSPSTVRCHRKNIRRKLHINNARYSLKDFLYSKGGPGPGSWNAQAIGCTYRDRMKPRPAWPERAETSRSGAEPAGAGNFPFHS